MVWKTHPNNYLIFQAQEVRETMRMLIVDVEDAESLGFLTVNKVFHILCNGFPSSLLKDLSLVFDYLILLTRSVSVI